MISYQKKKKIIILDMSTHRGRLGNQLMQFCALFSYAQERGYEIENYSFMRYARFFPRMQASISNPLVYFLLFSHISRHRFLRRLQIYTCFSWVMKKLFSSRVFSENDEVVFLPPSLVKNQNQQALIDRIEQSPYQTVYLIGWLWRNPVGNIRYRSEIKDMLQPHKVVTSTIEKRISAYRKKFAHIIGVHIRMGDTRLKEQVQYVPPEKFLPIMRKYLEFKNLTSSEILFLVCSDEKIDPSLFEDLNVIINGTDREHPHAPGQPAFMDDLYTLAATDALIAAHSTFSAFSSYIGNIPMIVVDNIPMDWEYYRNKDAFFENKYCTMAHYEN